MIVRLKLSSQRPPSQRDVRTAVSRLCALMRSGMSASEALRVGASTAGGAGRLLARCGRMVTRGQSLSRSLERSAPTLTKPDLALLHGGEQSGQLTRSLGLLERRLLARVETRRRMLQAFAYPTFLALFTLLAVTGMGLFVLPAFAGMYGNTSLPASTRIVLRLATTLSSYGPLAVATIIAAAISLSWSRRFERVRLGIDRSLLAVPLLGAMVLSACKEQLYATVAVLLEGGMDVEEALALAEPAVPNALLRRGVGGLRRQLQRGSTLSRALKRSGLDPQGNDAGFLEVAEATGTYRAAFSNLAAAASGRHEELLSRITGLAEPLAVSLMAIVVTTCVLAVYQPVLGSAARISGGLP